MADLGFSVIEPIMEKVEDATSTFINGGVSDLVTAVSPVITAGLTLSFVIMGVLVMMNRIEMPLMDFLGRSLKIGIITSIAIAGGMYQTHISSVLLDLPDSMSALISGADGAAGFDGAAGKGFKAADIAFEAAGFSGSGIVMAIVGIIILIITGFLFAIGAGFLIVGKVFVATIVALGPIFILTLLFKPTERFFELWVSQFVNYLLLIFLVTAVFSFLMDIFGAYVNEIDFNQDSMGYTVGGIVIMGIAFSILLFQVPQVASGLAGGVSMGWSSAQMSSIGRKGGTAMQAGMYAGGGLGKLGAAGASSATRGLANIGSNRNSQRAKYK